MPLATNMYLFNVFLNIICDERYVFNHFKMLKFVQPTGLLPRLATAYIEYHVLNQIATKRVSETVDCVVYV